MMVLATGPARADDATDAEALIRQGNELRSKGKDERALPLYQKAYEQARTARTAGQLGLCEMALGYNIEAEAHLSEAMESSRHPWVVKNRGALTAAIADLQRKIGEIALSGRPAGATLRLNHRVAGQLPLQRPARVSAGRVEIEVTAPGHRAFNKSVTIEGGGHLALTVELELEPSSDGAAAVTTTTKPEVPAQGTTSPGASTTPSSASTAAPEEDHVDHAASEGSGSSARRTLAYVGAGAAVVALAFAGFETVRWQGKQSDFDKHLGPGVGGDPSMPASFSHDCGGGDPMRGGAGCSDLYEAAKQARTLAVVGYAAGALLAGGAAALFLSGGDGGGTKRDVAACFPDPLSHGAGCRWSF